MSQAAKDGILIWTAHSISASTFLSISQHRQPNTSDATEAN